MSVADLVTSVNKMSGGPSTRVQSAIVIATKAVRIMSGSGYAAQNAVSNAPLPFRGRRYFRDLVRRVGLPPKREGKILFFITPLYLQCYVFAWYMIAKPAFWRTRKRLAVDSDQHVPLLQTRFARSAVPIHGKNARGGRGVAIDGETQIRATLAGIAKAPSGASQKIRVGNLLGARDVAAEEILQVGVRPGRFPANDLFHRGAQPIALIVKAARLGVLLVERTKDIIEPGTIVGPFTHQKIQHHAHDLPFVI